MRNGSRPGTTLALIGAIADLAVAAALGAIRTAGASPGQAHAEGALPTIAIVAVVAAPGIVALVGVALARPVLFGAAGFACGPLVILSIVAFPLVVPGGLLIVAFIQSQHAQPSAPLLTGLVFVGFPVPLLVGLRILVTETAQYTYNFPGGSEAGGYFTPAHALQCIALVAVDVGVASFLARLGPAPTPSRRR
ncbi:MAG TPA: hypothetical protein VIJ48_08395 [Acidimicrobiia bacterium]